MNQVGEGETFTFAGGTMAVSADGEHLATSSTTEDVIEFSLRPLRQERGEVGGSQTRLPEGVARPAAGEENRRRKPEQRAES